MRKIPDGATLSAGGEDPTTVVLGDGRMLDALYDNEQAVPEWRSYVAHWNDLSEIWLRSPRANVVQCAYGSGQRRHLDLFWPETGTSTGHALLMFIHGGYWYRGDKRQNAFIARAFTQAGITVAMPNYSLSPDADIAEISEDISAAVRWLGEHVLDPNMHKNGMWIAGHSAGAQLAAMQLAGQVELKGGILISGVYELDPLSRAPFLRGRVKISEPIVATQSPARLAPRSGVAVLGAVGEYETKGFHDQLENLRSRWSAVEVQTLVASACNHLDVVNAFGDERTPIFKQSLALLTGR